MKTIKLFSIAVLIALLSGCVVYSFYPLYTQEDLFANDILTGSWTDADSSVWVFNHPVSKNGGASEEDKTSYELKLSEKDGRTSTFTVHIVKISDHYFLDFFLQESSCNNEIDLASMHLIPVHSFAKLTVSEKRLEINWFDPEWLEELMKDKKEKIEHENNGEVIMLTAKPEQLQKFVKKYAGTEKAFKDGLFVKLEKNAKTN